MLTIHNEFIIEALKESNKWWFNSFELNFKDREIYNEIKKFIKTRQILAVTGLRRVGKTMLMLKIVKDNIKDYNHKNILYFSFDDFKTIRIRDVINIYAKINNIDLEKDHCLFLFDEIQKLENWEEQIKRLYDNFGNIKIIISGSESLFIRKNSRESLAGRFFEFKIKPLNFREYLLFKEKKLGNIELYKEDILREFHQFLLCNGFPETINQSEDFIKKYIRENIIEKVIYRDIQQILNIRDPATVEEIFKIILFDPGEILNLENLSKDLGVSRQTISTYLDYLEKSFLIKKIYNFSRNPRKNERKLKKYYPTVLLPNIIEKGNNIGRSFETAMILQLEGEFFWRDQYKNEVDLIKIDEENNIIPMEIKYNKIDTKALKRFMMKFKINKGFIITYDKKDILKFEDKEIKVIPFYEMLLQPKES